MKKVLIFIIFILIIGGITMLFGFKDNKCKQEVYSKDEVDSKYFLKDNIAVIYGKIVTPAKDSEVTNGQLYMSYPTGFNKSNSAIISLMVDNTETENEGFATVGATGRSSESVRANYGLQALMSEENIYVEVYKVNTSQSSDTVTIRLILMKLPEPDISGYQLGDVNMDGQVTEEDKNLVLNYSVGNISLTDKQIKLADMNGDGEINSEDAYKILELAGYQLGDVNMDGAITEDDFTLLSQYLENTATLTDTQIKLADVNKDGQLTSADLMQMRKYLNGEIDSF